MANMLLGVLILNKQYVILCGIGYEGGSLGNCLCSDYISWGLHHVTLGYHRNCYIRKKCLDSCQLEYKSLQNSWEVDAVKPLLWTLWDYIFLAGNIEIFERWQCIEVDLFGPKFLVLSSEVSLIHRILLRRFHFNAYFLGFLVAECLFIFSCW